MILEARTTSAMNVDVTYTQKLLYVAKQVTDCLRHLELKVQVTQICKCI